MTRVHVPLGDRGYDVVIGRGLTSELTAFMPRLNPSSVVVVTDTTVGELYGAGICRALDARSITVPAGEQSKSLATLQAVYAQLLDPRDLDRDCVVVALGGGVVGDLAGFAAATLFRGVRWVQAPTSLLAMLDSAIGGKTAINHSTGKNLIGAFHQPAAVFCDLDCLSTLPQREYASALAEAVKAAVIVGAPALCRLEELAGAIWKRENAALTAIIELCAHFKAAVVAEDELDETGGRARLNFGHTLAHALENVYPDRWLHGEAVAIGLCGALRLSVERGGLAQSEADRVQRLLEQFELPVAASDVDVERVRQAVLSDKKRKGDRVRLVVLRAPGQPAMLEEIADLSLIRKLLGSLDG